MPTSTNRCPPCKAIAPLFEQLAAKNTIPDGLAFAKVDVDTQREVAQRYGISAMPTFILLEDGKEAKSVRGANASAIRDLVKHAKAELAKEKEKRGEEVDAAELENDGVDESHLPQQPKL
jgi:thioredoxin 1